MRVRQQLIDYAMNGGNFLLCLHSLTPLKNPRQSKYIKFTKLDLVKVDVAAPCEPF